MELNEGKQCKKCRAIKLLSDFNRRLTPAEAKARGYKGDYLVTIESSLCRACRPRRKPPRELTPKEIQNRHANGEINVIEKETLLKIRKARLELGAQMRTRERWVDEWKASLKKILDPMQEEIQSIERQFRYSMRNDRRIAMAFFKWHAELLRVEKAKIELDFDKNQRKLPDVKWESLLSGTVIMQTREKWGEIPLDERARLKQPALVVYRPQEPPKRTLPIVNNWGGKVSVIK